MHNSNKKHLNAFILLLALYETAIYLACDAYLPALPTIASELNTSSALMQLTLTSWFIGSALLYLIIGPIADRVGRRQVLLWGGLIFILSTIGCALVHNIHALLALRFIQGALVASMIVPGYATIHDLFDREQAIHLSAIISSITVLSPAFGPLGGAFILRFASWRWIFWALTLWAIVTFIGLFITMPNTETASQEKQHLRENLKQYRDIITNRTFMLLTTTLILFISIMIAWITEGPFLVIENFHYSTLQFSIMQILIFGSFIVSTRSVKYFMKYFKLTTLIHAGLGLSLISGILAFVTALIAPHFIWNVVIAMMLLSLGAGIAFPILNRLAIESSSEPMNARVAIIFFFLGIAGMIGSAIISSLSSDNVFSLSATMLGLSLLGVISYYYSGYDEQSSHSA